jgi:hypothetical protein
MLAQEDHFINSSYTLQEFQRQQNVENIAEALIPKRRNPYFKRNICSK